ncbi:MAG: methionine--tRNA ligase [Oscillospiraceae bacterium]|jgi:methionyl-tRNA synthetase|nr:methionine--tRNA ligase [Oscillospiraceae bacterium]
MKNILIGGAWPYANGSLHIGHIAGLLPGDILARYYRSKGNRVFYVSGSDCHGTPVTIRAKQEEKTPQEISDFYHDEFVSVFNALGFSYDLYTKTSDEQHKTFVKEFHKKLYAGDYVYEKTVKQAFCPTCDKTLTDRLIIGKCPICGEKTRGDQCDDCGEIIEIDTILSPVCADCGSQLTLTDTTQLFIAISKLEKELTDFLNAHPYWRKNAIAFTKRYIDEGLRDRAITRDLDWGIDVPKSGYEDKKIYIWAENVLGYLSASKAVCDERGISFDEVWGKNTRHYYVHGKDNIPFHTIILPSLLLGHGGELRLPDDIISSEYITLEGKKISTSQNRAIWAKDIVNRYNPDALRYFFIANGPEKRDTDFSLHEFVERNNSELLGAYGNFVNRTLAFISKYLDGIVPNGVSENEIAEQIEVLLLTVGQKIEDGQFKDALESIFEFVRFGNKYFDANEPWKTRENNPNQCCQTLFNCVQIIANLSVLLQPFLPFSSAKVFEWLNLNNEWKAQWIQEGYVLPEISILFKRLGKKIIDEEYNKLTEPKI